MTSSNDTPEIPAADGPEQEWPTTCEHCGTELRSEVLEAEVTNDWNEGSPVPMIAQDVCPNPDCPGKVSPSS